MVRFSVYGKNFGGVFTLKMGEISGDGDKCIQSLYIFCLLPSSLSIIQIPLHRCRRPTPCLTCAAGRWLKRYNGWHATSVLKCAKFEAAPAASGAGDVRRTGIGLCKRSFTMLAIVRN